MITVAPYGSWRSPISSHDLAASAHPVLEAAWGGDEVWWLERRPSEGGRSSVRTTRDGAVVDILPAPWNARTRVHEYGGAPWAVTEDGVLVFAEFTDQRLYRLDAGSQTPVPITPAGGGFRFADLAIRGDEVIAVRDTEVDGEITRDIVAVAIWGAPTLRDGRCATSSGQASSASEGGSAGGGIRSIVSGSHFLAWPRFSPDGGHIAWIGWEHPQMPWDGTELRVAELEDGVGVNVHTLIGSTTESVLQPEWNDDGTLTVVTDRSGWWNLVSVTLDGDVTELHRDDADFGGAAWTFGDRWHARLDDGRILAVRSFGEDTLVILDPATGASETVDIPFTSIELAPRNGDRVLLLTGSSTTASGLRVLDLASGSVEDVRLDLDGLPPAGYLPVAEPRTFHGKREVHAFVYPPTNADFVAPEGELPPFIAFVHGGPTSRVTGDFSLTAAYFTSRGIGVVDINYGGSTGYGREYRDRLRGHWGVVDVEDTVATMVGLADAGLADRARLAIRGGSAGGWTVLAALTSTDLFAAGASYFGVADAMLLATDTHDFESRYMDSMIGPLPEAAELYAERAPINHLDRLTTPVLVLQGLDDPIVTPEQAETLVAALVAHGQTHAYLTYEGESHGFRKAETIIHSIEAELSFYGQVMGFEPVDVPKLPLS
jgi:dipeptidyl aminopeptidase/acylaminoacyl peptidase